MELATGEGDPRGLVDDHVHLWHHWENQCHPWRLRIYRRNVRTQSSYVKNLFAYRIWSPFAYSMMLILSVFVTRCVSRQRFENKNVTILVTMTTSQVCKLRALLSASWSGTVQELGGREGARLLLPRSTSWGRAGAAPRSQCVPAVSGGAFHSVIIFIVSVLIIYLPTGALDSKKKQRAWRVLSSGTGGIRATISDIRTFLTICMSVSHCSPIPFPLISMKNNNQPSLQCLITHLSPTSRVP